MSSAGTSLGFLEENVPPWKCWKGICSVAAKSKQEEFFIIGLEWEFLDWEDEWHQLQRGWLWSQTDSTSDTGQQVIY